MPLQTAQMSGILKNAKTCRAARENWICRSKSSQSLLPAKHTSGAFSGISFAAQFGAALFIPGAVCNTHTRYRNGSSPFSFAVSIILKITALPCAPFGVLANRKFFLSITNGLMLRSARLLDISNLPSSRYRISHGHCSRR